MRHVICTSIIFFITLGTGFTQDVQVYRVAEVMPTVKGCEQNTDWHARHQCAQEKIAAHLKDNLRYPSEAEEAGQEGIAVVSFVVTDNGVLDDFAIIEDPGYGMGDAALKALRKMRKDWVAGSNKGVAVNTLMRIPVPFTLPEVQPAQQEVVLPEVFTHPDQMPRFAGCEGVEGAEAQSCTFQKLTQFVRDSLEYPEQARTKKIEGTVITKFVVDEEGQVIRPEIEQGIGGGCEEEALRLLGAMPAWTPGMYGGKVVKVEMRLPFQFRLGTD